MGYNIHDYSDIIDLPHHVSKKRPQMDHMNRAAQFSPFAALTGYEEAIKESNRLTDSMVELTEDEYLKLDEMFAYLTENLSKRFSVTITYFAPDLLKEGGSYEKIIGIIKKIDEHNKVVHFMDGTSIFIDQIVNMKIE